MDNYQLQAQQAKKFFLTYDQQRLISKLSLRYDEAYLYTSVLCQPYRIHRGTGDLQKQENGRWLDANTHAEVMTLLDLVCDSREDRKVSGRWVSLQLLGRMFHRQLAEQSDPLAEYIDTHPQQFQAACLALQGQPLPGGDMGWHIPFFDCLRLGLQFWHSDEEFPPKLHIMWDENALQFLRYETAWFATGLIRRRLRELMDQL